MKIDNKTFRLFFIDSVFMNNFTSFNKLMNDIEIEYLNINLLFITNAMFNNLDRNNKLYFDVIAKRIGTEELYNHLIDKHNYKIEEYEEYLLMKQFENKLTEQQITIIKGVF